MGWQRVVSSAFAMDDAAWKRHANPWSFWTRIAGFVFLVLAIWSRVWLGSGALVLVAAAAIWLWINPRAFPPPASTDNWASKAVLGERVWINRDAIPIPAHHARMASLLTVLSAAGTIILFWGLYALDIWPTFLGMAMIMLGKLWLVDRMVWLYEDMKNTSPEYRSWLY
jgi:uncharacterized membrane protein HdeD (DUF308 family)